MNNPFSTDSRQQKLQSPEQIGSVLKITSVPSYLIALTAILLLGAFMVWGFLGNVSDKVYYSGVVFPNQGTADVSLPNKGMIRTMLVHSGDHVLLRCIGERVPSVPGRHPHPGGIRSLSVGAAHGSRLSHQSRGREKRYGSH